MNRFIRPVFAIVASLLVLPSLAQADDVQWRFDYAAAVKESQEKNRPIFIDCFTESCFWCRRLEASCQDGSVVDLLNNRFIPLKLDAGRYADIVQTLEVRRFPTMIHAAPDGTIVLQNEGYLASGSLLAQLQKTLDDLARVVARSGE